MADLPQVGLQPQAAPTDQYAAPEVRRKIPGAGLIQLADALKGFSASANEVYNRQFAQYQQNSAMQADRFSGAAQYKNIKDLKGSVDRGEIPMWANPWFQVRLKQDTARNEVTTASAGIENDLRNSDVMHQDDPKAVQQFIGDRYGQLMQGRDAWETAAMAPEIANSRQAMMNRWVQQRGADRIGEAHQAVGNVIMTKMDGFDSLAYAKGDPASTQQLGAMTTDIQAQYDQLLHVVDKATATDWISSGVLEAAKVHRNADVAREVLDSLKGADGIKLSSTADNRAALEKLPREIQELKNADLRAETEGKQLAGVKERQNLMEEAQKMMKDQGVQHLWQVKLDASQWQKLSPEGYAEVQRFYASLAQQALTHKNAADTYASEPLIQDLLQKSVRGELKAPDRINLMAALAANGEVGRSAVETFGRFLHYQRDLDWGDTTPATMALFNTKLVSGTLKMSDVLDESAAGHLNQHDASEYMAMAATVESSGVNGRHSAIVGEATKELHDLVQAPYLKEGLIGGRDSQDNDQMRLKETQAETAFHKEFILKLTKSEGWDKLSFAEQQKQVDELRDAVARRYGGLSMQQFLKDSPQSLKPNTQTTIVPSESAQGRETKLGGSLATQDKVVASMDEATVRDVSRLIKLPTDQPPLEVLRGGTANGGVNIGEGLADGHQALMEMADLRSKIGSFINSPTTEPKLDETAQTLNGSRTAYMQYQKYVKAYSTGVQQLQQLQPVAEAAPAKIQAIRDAVAKNGGQITFDQQTELKTQLLRILAYADLRKQIGYSVGEVKQMGESAWRSVPMFRDVADLKSNGPSALKQLGVKDFQEQQFYEAQLTLLKNRDNH